MIRLVVERIPQEFNAVRSEIASAQATVNVKSYGALGDGSTNDATAIQAAIDASAEGDTVFFPAGVYLVGSTISLKSGRAYVGAVGSDLGGTRIKAANGSNLAAVLASAGWVGNAAASDAPLRITGLAIDGNRANNTGGDGLVLMTYGAVVEHVWVKDCDGTGIRFTDANAAGTTISNTAVENRLQYCKVADCGNYGIHFQQTGTTGKLTDAYVLYNIISGCANTSIQIDRGAGFWIVGNHIYFAELGGIFVGNCWATYILDNEIDGFGEGPGGGAYISGIEVQLIDPRATMIRGNIICSTEPAGYNYQYLAVAGASTTGPMYATITDNQIYGGLGGAGLSGLGMAFGRRNSTTQPIHVIQRHNAVSNVGSVEFIDSSADYVWDAGYSDRVQPLDDDLTAIAALSPSDNDIIQRKSGAWVKRTLAQLKADLDPAPYSATYAGTMLLDPTDGDQANITATNNITSLGISTTGAEDGQWIVVAVLASGGNRTVTPTTTASQGGVSSTMNGPFTIPSGKVALFSYRFSSLNSSWTLWSWDVTP